VWRGSTEITDQDDLGRMLRTGYAYWINDSYWMFMPYKLKDSGVTLKYMGKAKTSSGEQAHVLELRFKQVGLTPDNRYLVYVDPVTMLVTQWDYFEDPTQKEPGMSTPWRNWTRFGRIMLSADRGERGHTDLVVYDSLPESVFTSPEPVDLAR